MGDLAHARELLDCEGLAFVDAQLLQEFLRPAVKQREEDKRAAKARAAKAAATRKAKREQQQQQQGDDNDDGAGPKRKPRGKKGDAVVTIDFSAPVPADALFAGPPRSAKSTLLSDASLRRALLDGPAVYLLPAGVEVPADDSDGEEGAAKSAKAAPIAALGHGDSDDDDDMGGGGGGFEYDGDDGGDGGAWADSTLIQVPSGVDTAEIHYARVAKTVRLGLIYSHTRTHSLTHTFMHAL